MTDERGTRPRLVATDLDGTIVRSDGTISERTIAAFARVERAGARFVLVTGRPPRAMAEIARAFGASAATSGDGKPGNTAPRDTAPRDTAPRDTAPRDTAPGGRAFSGRAFSGHAMAICSNGALTYDLRTSEVIPGELIQPEQLAAAARALREAVPGIGIAVEYPDGRAADYVFQPIMFDLKEGIPRHDDTVLLTRPAAKLLGRHLGYSPDELLAIARPVLDGLVTVTHSNAKGLVECAAVGVSKATAVAALAAAMGIAPEDAIAFGDQPNDLPLLAWAGTSCAVANAHPAVLAAATHVIGGNDDDGVARYLEDLYR